MAGTIRKRSWVTRKGETKSNWTAYYTDQNGHRRKKAFAAKKVADAWLLRTRGEIRDGIHTPEGTSITVAEAGRLWLERCATDGLERGSLQQYRTHLKLYIKPLLGSVRLAQLTPPEVEAWRDKLLQKLTRQRALLILSSLKSILKDAQRRGHVVYNAAQATRIDLKKRKRELIEIGRDVPSTDEVQAILSAAPERWRPVLVTAAFTGMRTGELRGLTWDVVDLARRVIRVRQRADFWGALGAPKTAAGRREIPLAPIVVSTLREWRLAYPYGPDGIVFCTRTHGNRGGVLNHGELWRVFCAAQRQAGVVDTAGKAKYHFHALRHFFASAGIAAGFSPKRLQVLLGHASITMTYDVYGHLFPSPEDDHARLAAIEHMVTGAGAL
jgi:integrase